MAWTVTTVLECRCWDYPQVADLTCEFTWGLQNMGFWWVPKRDFLKHHPAIEGDVDEFRRRRVSISWMVCHLRDQHCWADIVANRAWSFDKKFWWDHTSAKKTSLSYPVALGDAGKHQSKVDIPDMGRLRLCEYILVAAYLLTKRCSFQWKLFETRHFTSDGKMFTTTGSCPT